MLGCALWALAPIQSLADEPPESVPKTAAPAIQDLPTPIDTAIFSNARLWNPPPVAVPAQPQVAQNPSKPFRLQLIGIIHEGEQLHAALYDPDADRIVIVASGQRINDLTVVSVGTKTVELSDGQSKHELRLQETGS